MNHAEALRNATLTNSAAVGASKDGLLWSGPERIRLQTDMINAMDTKVGVVLGFSAVAMGELLGYLLQSAIESSIPSQLFTLRVALPIALGFLAGISGCLVGASMLLVRRIDIGPQFGLTVSADGSTLLNAWKTCVEANERTLAAKARRAKSCIVLVLAQMMCYGVAALFLFLRFVSLHTASSGGTTSPAFLD